jgi:hypothetical protein
MILIKRLASSSLLLFGIVLVFVGMSAALGFTSGGMLASLAAIGALLYAGGVWFAPPAAFVPSGSDAVFVFDRSLRLAAGGAPGVSVLSQFPEAIQPEIGARCRAALRGESTHFLCELAGKHLPFDVAPVHNSSGVVMYGVLVCGSGAPIAAIAPAQVTTTA